MFLGGLFAYHEINLQAEPHWPFPESALFTWNARSALYLLIQSLKPERIWLPSFICPQLIDAVSEQVKISFYEIDQTLKPVHLRWTQKLRSDDLVLCPIYFGMLPSTAFIQALQDSPASMVVDAAQGLFVKSLFPDGYTLYSPRKWLGIPDGGVLTGPRISLKFNELPPPPAVPWLKMQKALLLRRDFDFKGKHDIQLQAEWFHLYQRAETEQKTGAYAMSSHSRAILNHAVNYSEIARIRRENFKYLLDQIPDLAVFKELPEQAVPLGFPIQTPQRDKLQHSLAKAQIYCPVHWRLENRIPSEFQNSHLLSEQILTLPIDQRYQEQEMHYLLKHLLKSLKSV
ncbi:hypothetical protein COW36_08110 [bacterium (Candidatus Blackallbacteria) CG17_big_fil_post_rev_8_21_14_2_50_48_46]|uniref:DegT/DnrJ/EryC1/StrS aminotransferase family protein n=1 Tax=bacterium (Candidatus Blackallbacteria) CG17_big_fil_post_rev_8_21_14_2_50_48_46 TaxID=2014261 RepID=A0A2M7G6C0_9BACT|nr:MAG: hypothetical protein COW64_24650 [bacterium (Candidatus Blackallbacteria) CG18_big_fil_WC_8_21_14_2_50_49_26]PIW17453.1 MAG: hypothetical protein COW36_08110 [bacterium (Candidatus Blackallbacteria) CG17_big_fil_post_rev_8_21_14_2_50_48_46]PIW48307.1 MAG: hypothetical protein COW20_09465 [bacterium (Candidatus Blackallbacteria) CG13_big_fil_rev_8_21_14_2_50_49_14]